MSETISLKLYWHVAMYRGTFHNYPEVVSTRYPRAIDRASKFRRRGLGRRNAAAAVNPVQH